MIFKGFKRWVNVQPGELIRTRGGSYAIMSEYRTNGKPDAHIYGSGEALHLDNNEWVAIIDLEAVEIETGLFELLRDYPKSAEDA